jgi:TfoX/Sxy family transcriptional regulator of competence genes
MLNDTLLKMIIGNDTISARALYGDVEMFKCDAKLIANTNGLPPLLKSSNIFSNFIQSRVVKYFMVGTNFQLNKFDKTSQVCYNHIKKIAETSQWRDFIGFRYIGA